jgi:hypothetical protein
MGYWKSMRDDDVEHSLSMGSSLRELAPHGWDAGAITAISDRRFTQESGFPISLAGVTQFRKYHCVTLVGEVRQVWLDVVSIPVYRVLLANVAYILYSRLYLSMGSPSDASSLLHGTSQIGWIFWKRQRGVQTRMTMKAHRWRRREEDARQGNIPSLAVRVRRNLVATLHPVSIFSGNGQ